MEIITFRDGEFHVFSSIAGAETGRWCKAPLVPDRCYNCFDPETLEHLPAEGYIEDEDGWREGICHRCHPELFPEFSGGDHETEEG